jgi:hypothetical protein
MASINYINNSNNTEVLERISRDFISEYGRGVTAQAELLMGVEIAKMNELTYSNNNFSPERFKNSLTKILSAVSSNDINEIDSLYVMHLLHSPK